MWRHLNIFSEVISASREPHYATGWTESCSEGKGPVSQEETKIAKTIMEILQNLNSRIDEVDKKSEERAKRSENT